MFALIHENERDQKTDNKICANQPTKTSNQNNWLNITSAQSDEMALLKIQQFNITNPGWWHLQASFVPCYTTLKSEAGWRKWSVYDCSIQTEQIYPKQTNIKWKTIRLFICLQWNVQTIGYFFPISVWFSYFYILLCFFFAFQCDLNYLFYLILFYF